MFRTYEDVFFTVMSYFTKRNGKLRWVEKTPAHIFSVNQILSEFPDAVFVELVRDPRDVMSSIKIMEKKGMWGGRIRYNPFFATLSFKLFNLAGVSAKKKYPSKIIRIRYEDLIEKPEQTIREVCRFLGQTFESAMLNISHYIPSEISREKRSVFSKEANGHLFSVTNQRSWRDSPKTPATAPDPIFGVGSPIWPGSPDLRDNLFQNR